MTVATPPVTVVIAVWDEYVSFLAEAVESVRSSADGEVPIVVVDNDSSTEVPELAGTSVLRAWRRLSAGAARSLGVRQVETEYVVVLDADDLITPGTVDFLFDRMSANPAISACATSLLEEDTGVRHRTPRPLAVRMSRHPALFALADCVWPLYPLQGCTMMRTAQVRDAGAYPDADLGDDWTLGVSLAFRGSVEIHHRVGLIYRATQDSLWRTPKTSAELIEYTRLVRERVRVDPGIPAHARLLLPLIAALQLTAVYGLRPVYLLARRVRDRLADRRRPSRRG